MKLRKRAPRYGSLVLFVAGLTAAAILAAALTQGFAPTADVWLSALLVVVLILYSRHDILLSKTQDELSVLRRLVERVSSDDEPAKDAALRRLSGDTSLNSGDRETLARLGEAIQAKRLDLYLQPIVSLPQRRVRFYEAFSRLRDADGSIMRPKDYLEAAERTNRIGVIDNLILFQCVQALREVKPGCAPQSFFCNISPATLCDEEFFSQFTDYLETNEDLAPRLVFEFTLPALQIMHPRVENKLASIAERGFCFSVDHVHHMEINVERLRRLNVRYLKASSALLNGRGPGLNANRDTLLAFRQQLADAYIDLIAEKIECESDVPEILDMAIDYGQGVLFGHPRPAAYYLEGEAAELRAAS
ncbi:MAG: EAL domain-containing protein [Pseudomonadota bacterium]